MSPKHRYTLIACLALLLISLATDFLWLIAGTTLASLVALLFVILQPRIAQPVDGATLESSLLSQQPGDLNGPRS